MSRGTRPPGREGWASSISRFDTDNRSNWPSSSLPRTLRRAKILHANSVEPCAEALLRAQVALTTSRPRPTVRSQELPGVAGHRSAGLPGGTEVRMGDRDTGIGISRRATKASSDRTCGRIFFRFGDRGDVRTAPIHPHRLHETSDR